MSAVATSLLQELRLVARVDAHEGPVYAADEDALYFTSVRRGSSVALKRLDLRTGDVSVLRADANVANGMALDRDGSLLVCEQGTFETAARISRVDRVTGVATTVADGWAGRPLNSPNDVVVGPDGSIWFTDPSYGHLQGFRPPSVTGDHLYRVGPSGRVELAAGGFDKPNGLAFSPDGRTLYVADNGMPHHVVAFDTDGARVWNRSFFATAEPGHPDGLKVDAAGRVYGTVPGGIRVWSPDGEVLEDLPLAGAVNFCFGGPARSTLYVTTDTAVWAAVLDTEGA